MHIPTCALTTLSLRCDFSQISVPFSSAALTSKNENKANKLCNTKGEGLKFSLFLRQVAGRIFITDLPQQLQVPLYYPEMCVAPSCSYRQKEVRLADRIRPRPCIFIRTALHYLTCSQSSLCTPQHSPLAYPPPEQLIAMANTGEFRKLYKASS